MIFNYKLHTISYPYYIYKVYLNDSVFTLEIDLIQDYPNYEYVHNHYNNQEWHYVLSKSYDKKSVKGEIIKVDMTTLKKNSNPRFIIKDRNEYKIATQMDVDKYYYIFNIKNDNLKLFKYIYNYLLFYYENKYKEKQEKDIKIKNRYNETLL